MELEAQLTEEDVQTLYAALEEYEAAHKEEVTRVRVLYKKMKEILG